MNIVTEMPTTGQFVMLHTYQDEIFGDTYRWNDGKLEELGIQIEDEWSEIKDFDKMHSEVDIKGYLVAA